jgi:hypothetical protein
VLFPESAATGELASRLLLIEMAVAEQEQQLSAVVGQQEALKEVVTRLAASLEGANQNATNANVQELTKQVGRCNHRRYDENTWLLLLLLPSAVSDMSRLGPQCYHQEPLVPQVHALSQELAQLKAAAAAKADTDGLAEKMQDLGRKTEDRQARAETAIYQVGVWRVLRINS